ncbi:DUF1056 family protein [Lapidilactobacillus wuchangensis]|uniref:DUF1056 family protein n=1 Tax=Lapidilactobacillus wuchangensis TaxID=2486001 RepID=UPI0013DE7239|nr:DUF1056 family protein [Lapidilactobacillus wuchangensis]
MKQVNKAIKVLVSYLPTLLFLAGILALVISVWLWKPIVGGLALGVALIVLGLMWDRAADLKQKGGD